MIRNLGFSAPSLIFQKGWKQWSIVPIWWSLHKNPQSARFGELPGWWWYQEDNPDSMETEASGHRTLQTLPHLSIQVFVCFALFSFNKLVNVKCFLEFCEPLEQINQSRGGDHGTLSFVANWTDNLDLWLAPEVGWGQFCETDPLTHGLRGNLQVECVRTELHWRPRQRTAWLGETPTHLVPTVL